VPTLATALDFYTPDSRPRIESAVRRAAQDGVGWDLELQVVDAHGTRKWVRASGQAETLDGAPIALTGAFMDITQRVQLENELRQAQKLEAIGRLTGGIAHDFNNVLTAILSSAELLEKSPEQRTAKVANTIAKAASRAGDLTGKLLAFSRQQVLNPVVVDLNTAVQDAIELLRPLLVEEANIRTNFHATPLTTTLDLAQLTAAILNIALNARDAMPDGGSLEVSTHQGADNNVVLTLTDSGVGMSADVMDQMFDPFFTTKPEGVGLGLSMVHGFVTQSGGSISVRSTPGQGTSFELSFPAAPADVSGNADKSTLHTAAEARILLVDDDPLVGDALSLTLSDHGFIVSTASDGPTAITHAGAHRFDFAVVDVTLTREMSGVELVKLLQRADPDLTAVLISGHAAAADIPAESTRTHFLQKPFKMETLLALLHRPGTEVARAS